MTHIYTRSGWTRTPPPAPEFLAVQPHVPWWHEVWVWVRSWVCVS